MYGIWNPYRKEWQFGIEEPTYWKAKKALIAKVGPRDARKWRFEIRIMQAKARGFRE